MKLRDLASTALVLLVTAGFVASGLTVATHNPGNPRNDTVNGGAMQCNTAQIPVHKAGQTPTPPPVGHIRFVVFNQDQGHLRIQASGNAIGPVGCTFGIEITGTTCTGLMPSCGISNVVQVPCSAQVSGCTATADLDFWFEFTNPIHAATTHQYINYDLVVWTGMQPTHVNKVVVASGVVEYYEPPNPTPVDIPAIVV